MDISHNNIFAAGFKFPLLAFVFVVLSCGPTQASAINECIDACFSGFSCATIEKGGSIDPVCEGGRDRCVKQCNDNINGRTEAPAVAGAYGAIAYDEKSGAWGMADASEDKNSAKESALAYCRKHGSDCEIVESFSNTCAAVATGTGNRLGWGVNDDAKQAALDAIKKCGESGSSGNVNDHSRCFMQLYHCYSS